MLLLRSLLFTSFFFISTTLYAIGVLLVAWALPFSSRWAIARSWAWLNLGALKVLCNLDFVVEGREHIPPGAHVAMWKHSSTWETIAQALVFPAQAWVLKRELMLIPIVGWALRFMQPIAINRAAGGSAVKQVIAQGRERLASGRWVVIFPEGTRTREGESRKYGLSGFALAHAAGVKIVPVAQNAGCFWPRRGWLKKAGTVRVVIGPAIDTSGHDARELSDIVKQWIDTTTARISITN